MPQPEDMAVNNSEASEKSIFHEILKPKNNTKTSNNKSVEYSKYPLVSRDYALLVNEDVAYQNIVKELKKASNYIKNIELFDLYKGSNIKEGKVSIALSITLEKLDNTFTNEEINQIDAKVKDVIVNKIKGELRS